MKVRNLPTGAGTCAVRAVLALVVSAGCACALADTYRYDARGDVESITNPRGVRAYDYDERQRLWLEQGYTGNREHEYDLNGNRATDGATAPGSPTLATYAPDSNRIATLNGAAVTIDAAGQITSDGLNTYTWDAAGRLKTVSRGGQLRATYHYDHRHRRTRKVTTAAAPQGAQSIRYQYDDRDRLMAETTDSGVPVRSYVRADDSLIGIAEHVAQGGGYEIRMLYLELDHLGTPRQARREGGTVVWRWESDGYGTTPADEDPDGDGQLTKVYLRFPGQYYDEESGLHYNWHRYYVPRLGRYLSSDPIGVAGGANTFSYAGGSPLSNVDPDGLWALNALGGFAGLVTGGIGGYISSGGDWRSAAQGAAAGGAIGLLSPASALGTLFGGVASSAMGQVIGNLGNPCSEDPWAVDWRLAGVAGAGALGGRALAGYLVSTTRSASSYSLSQGLGAASPAAQKGFGWFVEGSAGGWTEYGANQLQSAGKCGCK